MADILIERLRADFSKCTACRNQRRRALMVINADGLGLGIYSASVPIP